MNNLLVFDLQSETSDGELARVTLVNEKCQRVYDTLVKPYAAIKNYKTEYGIAYLFVLL